MPLLGWFWGAKLGSKSVLDRTFLVSFLSSVFSIDFSSFFIEFLKASNLKNEVFAWEGCNFLRFRFIGC